MVRNVNLVSLGLAAFFGLVASQSALVVAQSEEVQIQAKSQQGLSNGMVQAVGNAGLTFKEITIRADATIAVPTLSQNSEQQIEEATLPLPQALRAGATVIALGPGSGRSVLRRGTNQWICVSDEPTTGFRVWCYHQGLDAYFRRSRELAAQGKDREARFAVLAAEVKAGKLDIPYGALLFNLAGARRSTALPPTEVRVPFATAESTGLPTEPDSHRPWLMRAGTVEAHIMFPGS